MIRYNEAEYAKEPHLLIKSRVLHPKNVRPYPNFSYVILN